MKLTAEDTLCQKTHRHVGSFPQLQHFFAAAQENEDIGALWKGPSMP